MNKFKDFKLVFSGKINQMLLLIFIFGIVFFSSNCSKAEVISGEEIEKVLIYIKPITNGILDGHNNLDYA